MEDLYRNLIVTSYPSYSQTLELVNVWDVEHQNLFAKQMQVLLDSENLDAEISPAYAAEITQEFIEIYDEFLQKNRELNLQRFSELSANSSNAQDLADAYEVIGQSIAVTLQRQQESMHTRYGQMLDEFRQKAAGVKQYSWATAGDEKVRDSHAARDGQLFDWNDSPTPGQEPNCRCSAVPASFFDKDASGIAEPIYPELLLPVFRALGLVRSLFSRNTDWKFGEHKSEVKWQNRMNKRDWTEEQITDTIKRGKQFSAPNYVNKSNGATRYQLGDKFVVRDDKTLEILQISDKGFLPK